MLTSIKSQFRNIIALSLTTMLVLAFARSYLRTQTTLIGYELGDLKDQEANLLEQRSHLQMELAKLTTRTHLTLLAQQKDIGKAVGTLASH